MDLKINQQKLTSLKKIFFFFLRNRISRTCGTKLKRLHMCITGFLEGEENDQGAEKIYEGIMVDRTLNLVEH